jgi:hypothetical protein
VNTALEFNQSRRQLLTAAAFEFVIAFDRPYPVNFGETPLAGFITGPTVIRGQQFCRVTGHWDLFIHIAVPAR